MDRRVATVVVVITAICLLAVGVGPIAAADGSVSGSDATAVAETDASVPGDTNSTQEHGADEDEEVNDSDTDGDANAGADEESDADIDTDTEDDPDAEDQPPANLTDEPIGQVHGILYNESIEVDQSDGLTPEELEVYIARSMARVEYLRDVQFIEPVSVDVMTRDEYREQNQDRSVNESFNAWNNVVWQALFIVDSETDVRDEFEAVRGEAVAGFYDATTGNITIVTEDPEEPVIDNATLIHELVHALQDQHYNLSDDRFNGQTQDEELGILGLIEGDADYAMLRYIEYCESEWECVETPRSDQESGPHEINMGIWGIIFQPYSDGPAYIHEIVTDAGWDGVNELYADPPMTSREIIHREPFEYEPVEFEDTSGGNWSTFPEFGNEGADRVGEASIFTMFWYQNLEYDIGVFDAETIFTLETHPYSQYHYESSVSRGWIDDVLVPYYHEEHDDYGYVWQISWEETEQAAAFKRNYDTLLGGHGGERFDRSTWWIGSSGYDGAYRIEQNGSTVTIVHGPDISALNELRPNLEPEPTPPRIPEDLLDPVQPVQPVDFEQIDFGNNETEQTPGEENDTIVQPGLGVIIGGIAMLAYLFVAMNSRRR